MVDKNNKHSPEYAADILDAMKREYDAGNKYRVLTAVRYCAAQEVVVPEWAADAFCDAVNRWFSTPDARQTTR